MTRSLGNETQKRLSGRASPASERPIAPHAAIGRILPSACPTSRGRTTVDLAANTVVPTPGTWEARRHRAAEAASC